jgi:hypothetical protein
LADEPNVLLNHNVRLEIMRNAMKPFGVRLKVLEEREAALLRECYCMLVPETTRKALDALEQADKTFLVHCRKFRLNVGGQTYEMTLEREQVNHQYPTLPAAGESRHYDRGHFVGMALDYTKAAHRPLVDKVRKWADDLETYKSERSRAEKTLEALLKSVRSTKSLFKVWPEGRKHYSVPPLDMPTVKTGVPALQVADMNKLLGLVPA